MVSRSKHTNCFTIHYEQLARYEDYFPEDIKQMLFYVFAIWKKFIRCEMSAIVPRYITIIALLIIDCVDIDSPPPSEHYQGFQMIITKN